MIFRLLIACILIAVLFILIQQFRRNAPTKPQAWQIALGIGALMLIVLAATGRIHWIGAVLATLLAFIRPIIPLILRALPTLHALFKQYRQQTQANNTHKESTQETVRPTHHSMTRKDAFSILGLNESATRDEIVAAHRKLMQKVHPDRGGTDELAARVNQAKDVLLG